VIRRLAAVAAALGIVGLLAGAAVAASFIDATGDVIVVPEGAVVAGSLDLSGVEITNTPEGVITFRITLADAPALQPSSLIGIVLDLDQNPATGDDGTEAVIAYGTDELGAPASAFLLYRALAGELMEADPSGITLDYAGGVLVLTVSRSELLDTTGFTFQALTVVTTPNGSAAAVDAAPEEGAKYNLAGFAPPRPPKIVATRPVGVPAAPHAGKHFEVRSLATREDTKLLLSSGSVACSVRVGAAKLGARGTLGLTGARCAMSVPKNARGKLLHGTMTIRSTGLTAAKRTFSFRIR
jgi:hypothetical protein